MTKTPEKSEQPGGSLDALCANHDELRRQVAVSDEEIRFRHLEAATNKRQWYRDPSVLVATFALAVSVVTFVGGQVNVISERRTQDRNQLSELIQQLPDALDQNAKNPNSAARDSLDLLANTAAALMDKLGTEASTPSEKLEVAGVLVMRFNLPKAEQLATLAEQQSTSVQEKARARSVLANIYYQIGNAASARDEYRQAISLVRTPQKNLDSPLLRDFLTVDTELRWIGDDFSFAKNCQDETEQLRNAAQTLDRLPPDRVALMRTNLDTASKIVKTRCAPRAK